MPSNHLINGSNNIQDHGSNNYDKTPKKAKRTSWNINLTEFSKKSSNRIRQILEYMNFTPNPDKDLIKLTIGDPTVFGNFRASEATEQAMLEAIASGKNNGYVHLQGTETARQAVAEYSSNHSSVPINPENVLITNGCATGLDYCITALAQAGKNLLVPRPGYTIYETQAEGLGIEIRYYNLLPEKDWEIDLKHLESLIDENTAALIVINPSNPCGSVFSKNHIQDIVAICERNYLPIISDEIYEQMVFPGKKHIYISSVTNTVPVLICSGLTKRFIVPGWRMGWVIVHDPQKHLGEIMVALRNLSGRHLGANGLIQSALPSILKNTPQTFFDDVMKVIYGNAKLAFEILSQIPGLNPIMSSAAMFMMIGIDFDHFPDFKNDTEFVERLLNEQSVFCLPGACFVYPNYIRIVVTVPGDMIKIACQRIAEFCKKYYVADVKNVKKQHA